MNMDIVEHEGLQCNWRVALAVTEVPLEAVTVKQSSLKLSTEPFVIQEATSERIPNLKDEWKGAASASNAGLV
jgi:hypothetical protein